MRHNLKRALLHVSLCGLIAAAALLVNFSATPSQAQDRGSTLPQHLGELMNESMQVHHTKLWFAGHAGNWPLAAYEVRKLKETIEELKEAIVVIQTRSAKWQRAPVGEMLNVVDSHLNGLGKAVKDKNPTNFETAYRALTAACNTCHVRAGEPQIKIIVPVNGGNFGDQDFTMGGAPQ